MHSCEHDFWDHSCLLNFTCLETKSIFHIWGSSIYVLNIKVCSIWGSYNSLILQLVQVTLWYILLCSWSHDCILVSTFSLQGRLKLHTPFRHEPKKKLSHWFWSNEKSSNKLEFWNSKSAQTRDELMGSGYFEDWSGCLVCPVVQHLVRCYPSMCSGNSMLNHLSQVEKIQDHRVH